MAVWRKNGQSTVHKDVQMQRIAAGTIGGTHAVPSSFDGRRLSSVISVFDERLSYTNGLWVGDVGGDANDFIGEQVQGTTPGATCTLLFTGTSMTVIGRAAPYGGRADVYIDGNLQAGRINTFTIMRTGHIGGLNATDTSIPVKLTTEFPAAPGYIQIDDEIIYYTGTDSTHFTGCTRGANGSTAASHTEGSTVYAYSSVIEGYSQYQQPRIALWSNNSLPEGNHTLTLVVRYDADPNASATTLHLNAFLTGGAIGAPNIVTHLDTVSAPGVSINASGYSALGNYTLNTSTTDQQIIGIMGATAYIGSTAYWCGVQVDPTNGALGFYAPACASQSVTVVVTVTVLGAPL